MNEGVFFPQTSPWCHEQVGDAAQNRLCFGPHLWNSCLGGGFKYVLFSPRKLGKMNPLSRAYFSDGLKLNHKKHQNLRKRRGKFLGIHNFDTPKNHRSGQIIATSHDRFTPEWWFW